MRLHCQQNRILRPTFTERGCLDSIGYALGTILLDEPEAIAADGLEIRASRYESHLLSSHR
jgi:hypothetical protein